MRQKLTKRAIDALAPPTSRRLYVYDTELPGFGLAVTPADVRTFFVQYRTAGGRRGNVRRLAIGRYGPLTVDQARAHARSMLARAAQGEDPAAARGAHKTAPTVGELAPAFLAMIRAKRKPSTAGEYERQLEREILPELGRKRVADVTTADLSTLHLRMADRPVLANRVLALCGAFFTWAETQGHRAEHTNPARRVEAFPEQSRERFLSGEEITRLGAALTRAETVGVPAAPSRKRTPKTGATAKHRPKSADTPKPANRYAIAALRFLILSGWREGEARELRWDALDLERGLATLADTKTGKSYRALGAPAVQLLDGLPRLAGSPFVFPGAKDRRPIANLTRTWEAVRLAAGLEGVRLHDLRHSFASVGAGGGLSLPLIGALLGHANPSTTQRYAHLADDPRRVAADRVAGEIAAALSGKATTVTPIKRAVRGGRRGR